jgi:hypothetical protein
MKAVARRSKINIIKLQSTEKREELQNKIRGKTPKKEIRSMKEEWWLFKNTIVIAWENIMEKVKRNTPVKDR